MAMSGDALGLYMYNKLVDSNASADGQAVALANLQKLGQAIVEYITANAQVTVTVTVATTGTAAAQSGSGTGTGTIL